MEAIEVWIGARIGSVRRLPRRPSRRKAADRHPCTRAFSRNADFRRSMLLAKPHSQDLESFFRSAYTRLQPFLLLVRLECTRLRSLFSVCSSCKSLQLYRPPPHYISVISSRLLAVPRLPQHQPLLAHYAMSRMRQWGHTFRHYRLDRSGGFGPAWSRSVYRCGRSGRAGGTFGAAMMTSGVTASHRITSTTVANV